MCILGVHLKRMHFFCSNVKRKTSGLQSIRLNSFLFLLRSSYIVPFEIISRLVFSSYSFSENNIKIHITDHPCSTYVKYSVKSTYPISWYSHVGEHLYFHGNIWGRKYNFLENFHACTKWVILMLNTLITWILSHCKLDISYKAFTLIVSNNFLTSMFLKQLILKTPSKIFLCF